MKCPACKKELLLSSAAKINMETYNQQCVTVTLCCKKAVSVQPIVVYDAQLYVGDRTSDDWGWEFQSQKQHSK
jgi:hypothetical protein